VELNQTAEHSPLRKLENISACIDSLLNDSSLKNARRCQVTILSRMDSDAIDGRDAP
jgi:hypothetical protein